MPRKVMIRHSTKMVLQRWCLWLGRPLDRPLGVRREGKLSDLVKKFCPHIGQESFFELM